MIISRRWRFRALTWKEIQLPHSEILLKASDFYFHIFPLLFSLSIPNNPPQCMCKLLNWPSCGLGYESSRWVLAHTFSGSRNFDLILFSRTIYSDICCFLIFLKKTLLRQGYSINLLKMEKACCTGEFSLCPCLIVPAYCSCLFSPLLL
jgi:hypothetical protein